MATDLIPFILETKFSNLPDRVQHQAEICLLDLIGTAAAGATTQLSHIIRDHAVDHFGGKTSANMLFDTRTTSPTGAALAGGMTIDSIDAHDGYNPVKGHIGCGLFPALLAVSQTNNIQSGEAFLTSIAIGYEIAGRLGLSLHASTPDYHTSGAWIAVAVAAVCARTLGLSSTQTRHAMGIAEYHGPRSQMMRVIDHPTMLKDGSGFGAMAGVSAAYLAQSGFTGAPAITAEHEDVAEYWSDLGDHWLIMDQYFKPYPICRWAQAPVECVLALARKHKLKSTDVAHIAVTSFHEATRLATNEPSDTEQAQYSTSFPCAAALVRGTVGLDEISAAAFHDPEISRLSKSLTMREDEHCNATFPHQRHAKVTLHLKNGTSVTSDYMSPLWTAELPPTTAELREKFHRLADPILGFERAQRIETSLATLQRDGLAPLMQDLFAPI